MGKLIDLTGQRFGRLTVIGKTEKDGRAMWRCQCECGKETVVRGTNLTHGATKSCGCLSREKVSERTIARNTSHGARHTRLYNTWRGMLDRCNNHNHKQYKDYGGRGIRVCEEWKEFATFQKWAIENGYRDDLTIDRINNNGNYEPSNCRWTGRKQQCRNRRDNHLVTYKGQTKTLTEWAEQFQIHSYTLYKRLQAGWSVEKALLTPVGNYNKKQ